MMNVLEDNLVGEYFGRDLLASGYCGKDLLGSNYGTPFDIFVDWNNTVSIQRLICMYILRDCSDLGFQTC